MTPDFKQPSPPPDWTWWVVLFTHMLLMFVVIYTLPKICG